MVELHTKILLLNPPGIEFHTRSSRWGGRKNRSGVISLPIFLAAASALLRQNGLQVRLLDAAASNLTIEDVSGLIHKENVGIVVMEVSTTSVEQDAGLAGYLKQTFGVRIVFVGAHVSALPEETLKNYPVDVVCIGEYEETLVSLCQALLSINKPLEDVRGIAFLKDKEIIITRPRELINLDALPFPDYKELPLSKYYDPIVRRRPCLPLRASRGCPYNCIFCVAPQVFYNHKVRYRSPERVVDDIMQLITLGSREIFIDDDTFTFNKKWAIGICHELIRRKIRIDWSCFARYDNIDEEILKVLKKSNCYMLRFGIESGSQKILDYCRKGITIDRIKEASRLVKRCGMKTHVTVMFGLPGETKETMVQTLNLIKELDPDYAQFSIATPYPGTRFYQLMKQEGRLISDNWSDYDGSCKSVVRLEGLDNAELSRFVDYAYRWFYFRFNYILKRLDGIRCLDEIYYLVKSSLALIKSAIQNSMKNARCPHDR